MTKDKRVDQYIANAQPFARPIMKHLRALVHETAPDIQETIKWGVPFFENQGTVCSMAAFNKHMAFGFWKEKLMPEVKKYSRSVKAFGSSLGRITTMDDLPPDAALKKMIKQAVELNVKGIKMPRSAKRKKLVIPKDLKQALQQAGVWEAFSQMSYTHQKEYVEWITQAKQAETKARRMKKMLEWVPQGKGMSWKYE